MKLKQVCIFLSTLLVLLLISMTQLHAQGLPCDGGDPDVDCPIDTSVILLVAAVLFLSVKKMMAKKQVLKEASFFIAD